MIRWKRQVGIATVLTAVFGGLVAISTGGLLVLSLSSAFETTRSALASRLEALIVEASQQSHAFFKPMEANARWLAKEIAAGRIKPEERDKLSAMLAGATATVPQIAAVSYQYPDGSGLFYDAKAARLHQVNWPANWQVRLNRRREGRAPWPPPDGMWVLRPSVLDGRPSGTFIVPARTADGDIGVVAVRVDLSPLSRSLAANAEFRGYELVRFLLFNKRVVIGHPLLQTMGDVTWPTVDDVNDPYLKQLGKGKRYSLAIVSPIPSVETFALETDSGQRIFALKTEDRRRSGGELTIGVHFDPQAGAAELNRLISIAAIGAFLFIGSVLLAGFLGRRAAVPMGRLASAAHLVEDNRLDDVQALPVGPVRELAAAASAFNGMVTGLKERKKIRDLFGKYVPQDVASMLLSDEKTAQPRNAIATVFFLDIAGFSAMSEKHEPAEVVATINAFFSDAVQLIEAEGGMVTQFQGDAILAVFNVPVARGDHAAAATRAACAIVRKIAERRYQGHKLSCRIGINTGPLVAGAIGAQDRLSYTIYGDAVNVAARLEQLNKEYGTQVLLAAATAKQVEGLSFKEIGTVPIRGRDAPVVVFTPADL